MVYGRQPHPRLPSFGGLGGPPPRDLVVLLAVVFFTYACQFFTATRILPELMRLSPLVWRAGFLWQLVTYPFAGYGPPSFWIVLELVILFWFGRDVRGHLGARAFWQLLAVGAVAGSVVAVAVELLAELGGGFSLTPPFVLMQGQRILMVILVAAFATLYGRATIYLFFVLPVQARWFLPLEILFAFVGFLGTHDLAGFLGVCATVGATWAWLRPGGPRRGLREGRLRFQQWWIQQRLRRLRRRKGFTVVPGDRGRGGGPTTH